MRILSIIFYILVLTSPTIGQSIKWPFTTEPTMEQIEARAKSHFDSIYIANGNLNGSGYNSYMRKLWFYGMRLGKTKKMSDARQKINTHFYGTAAKTTVVPCTEGSNWTELGPNNTPAIVSGEGIGSASQSGIGIMCFLRPHPNFDGSSNQRLYAGGPSGLWTSINGGTNWTLVNTDKNTITSCSDVAIHPIQNTLYLATGEHHTQALFDPYGRPYEESRGLLKTTNGGTTWTDIGPYFKTPAYPDMEYASVKIGTVKLHPSNPDVVYLTAYFWSWGNGGHFEGKIFKSIDAGANWSVIYAATNTHLIDLEFKPDDPNVFYAAGFRLLKFNDTQTNTNALTPIDWTSKLGGTWIWRPNTASNIQTWTHTFRLTLGVTSNATEGSNYLYVAGSQQRDQSEPLSLGSNISGELCNIWCCTDVTQSNPIFTPKNPTGLPNGLAHQFLTLSVSPKNKDFLVLGAFGVGFSSNGGGTFTHVSTYPPSSSHPFFHPDTRCTVFKKTNNDATTPPVLFRCHDGGICKTNDLCVTWTNSSNGLGVARPYSVAFAETPNSGDPDKFSVGLQDCTTLITSLQGWTHAYGTQGDGMVVIIDPVDPNVMYREAQWGAISKTLNNWTSPTYISPLSIGSGLWVTPMILDPNNRHRLFVGKQKLGILDFTSNPTGSGTASVKTITNSPTSVGNGITSISIAPTNSNIIIVGYKNGEIITGQPNDAVNRQLFKTTDGGTTWTDISPIGGFVSYNNPVTSLVIHPENPNKIFVTYGGYGWFPGISRVLKSEDGGTSWTSYSEGLPGLPYQILVLNPNRAFDDEMYIGTDVGVYFRNKYMTEWQCFNGTLPNVPVTDLKINRNKKIVYAATFGRGVWGTPVFCPASSALTLPSSPNNFYASSSSITSTSLITNSPTRYVAYRAPVISLNAGFCVNLGSEFSAWNYSCLQFQPRNNDEDLPEKQKEEENVAKASTLNLTIAPNPSSGFFEVSFQLKERGKVNLSLLSMEGIVTKKILFNELKESGLHSVSVNTHDLHGIYIVYIETGDKKATSKVVIH
jgi:photosystem II stability/assembly factor-like uncharacterized protein